MLQTSFWKEELHSNDGKAWNAKAEIEQVQNENMQSASHHAISIAKSNIDCAVWAKGLWNAGPQVYLQGNQDGVLREIFYKIGTTHSYFVEFGFGYEGREINESVMDHAAAGFNTRLLFKQGWHGMYFDAVINAPAFNITTAVLTEQTIAHHFAKAGVPFEPDYVSVDVDSVDLWLLRGLLTGGYRPRVMTVEFDPNWPPDSLITFQPQWHAWTGHTVFGASAGAINIIAESFGYVPVHVMDSLDMFLIRKDVLENHCDMSTIPSFKELTRHLPHRCHRLCDGDDLTRVVYMPLALEGRMKEANTKAVSMLRPLGVCSMEAFEYYNHTGNVQ